MKKWWIVFGVLIVFGVGFFLFRGEDLPEVPEDAPVVAKDKPIDFSVYNYDFVDEEVKGILNGMIAGKRTAFYLPSVKYINVSRGTKYGVAYAMRNDAPDDGDYFVFNWSVDDSVVSSCGVGPIEAQGWIERGWTSFGKIRGEWIDHVTVYFSFPLDVRSCEVKYNFVLEKEGGFYDSKTLEFRIV